MNSQPISRPEYHQKFLDIQTIFHSIQGEGPFVGRPAVFVRLAGCNLRCPQCDTNYSDAVQQSAEQILEAVRSYGKQVDFVVLTGGEPLRQNIKHLVDILFDDGYTIQIETNGTLNPAFMDYSKVHLVCSPKTRIAEGLQKELLALKYVLHADHIDPTDGLPRSALGNLGTPTRPDESFAGTIYVQPIDVGDVEENKRHLMATIRSAMQFGYTLCIQVHKIINME